MIAAQTLIDLAVERNMAPTNYLTRWDEYADWQFETLHQNGLAPHHWLIDVGCGAMRLGTRAIPFLEPGHYCGIDPSEPLISLGHAVIERMGIDRPYTIVRSADFEFERFGQSFDYAMAQSVFTYLAPPRIERCVARLKPVMNPGGQFIFTYILAGDTPRLGFLLEGIAPMEMPGLADDSLFERIARELRIGFRILPETHPGQRVGRFTF